MLRRVSLRVQLIIVILFISLTAMGVAGAILFFTESSRARAAMIEELTSLADLLGDRSSAALVFLDNKTATENLRSLNGLTYIASACLFNEKGELFASFGHSGEVERNCVARMPLRQRFSSFDGDVAAVQAPVMVSARFVGAIQINSIQAPLAGRLWEQTLSLFVALGGVSVLVALMTLWMERLISRPIALIRNVATSIISTGDYSLRSPDFGNHELGQLGGAFNNMLRTIEKQNGALADSESRFRAMIEQAPEAILVFDVDEKCFVEANSKAVQLTGYARKELRALEWGRLHQDLSPQTESLQGYFDLVLKGEEATFERTLHSAKGALIQCEVRMVRLPSKDKRLIRASYIDITDRKRAEQELVRHKEHLEELVKERTLSLEAAVREAEAANLAKSTFLANMSHELRTPLTSVIGFSQMMASDASLSKDQKRKLEIITNSGSHLLTLINDVLELSKIESGQTRMDPGPTNIKKLINSIVEMMLGRAGQRGLTLNVQCRNMPDSVIVDAVKLRQVLLNLLSNAVKFTDRGGVFLEAIAGPVEDGRVTLEFAVTDTGRGISTAERERIFDPFVQGGVPGDQVGTGLGLSISRQFVRLMGGDLAVESGLGQGSTFRFSLAVDVDGQPQQVVEHRRAGKFHLTDLGTRHRVLIAEDNPNISVLLHDLLQSLGFDVVEVADGSAAVTAVEEIPPRLVIMDWRMPIMDGVEATRRIRAMPNIVQPSIVMLTATAFEEERLIASKAGVDDFLRKPFDLGDLLASLERHLGVQFPREMGDNESFVPSVPKTALTEGDLKALTAEQCLSLSEAIIQLSADRIERVLAQIREETPELAKRLKEMLDSGRHKEIHLILAKMKS